MTHPHRPSATLALKVAMIAGLALIAITACTRVVVATPTPAPTATPGVTTSKDMDLYYPTGDTSPVWALVKLTVLSAEGVTPAMEDQVRAVMRDFMGKTPIRALIGLRDQNLDEAGKVRLRIREVIVPATVRQAWEKQAGEFYAAETLALAEIRKAELLKDMPPAYLEYLRATNGRDSSATSTSTMVQVP